VEKQTEKSTLWVRWVRSGIGFPKRQKKRIRSLGLKRLHDTVELPDTPPIRGLVASIPHLVEIVNPASPPAWRSIPEYSIRPPAPAAQIAERSSGKQKPSVASRSESPEPAVAAEPLPAEPAAESRPALDATAGAGPAAEAEGAQE
jgi:large subunit ribosomal protein L30